MSGSLRSSFKIDKGRRFLRVGYGWQNDVGKFRPGVHVGSNVDDSRVVGEPFNLIFVAKICPRHFSSISAK